MAIDKLSVRTGPKTVVVYGYDDELAELASKKLDATFGPCRALGVGYDGVLSAIVVYAHARTGSCEVSLIVTNPRALTRSTLFHLFFYPFVTAGMRRITCLIDTDNLQSRRICERLGFKHEGTLRMGHPSGDAEIYGMLKPECKWLEYGKKIITSTTATTRPLRNRQYAGRGESRRA